MSAGDHPTRRRPGDRPSTDGSAAAQRAVNAVLPGAASGEIAGVVGEAAATRGGEDSRRRGWFWHWNSIVTQFAPLIGLKGVGLLNSYTVWTDRREESPHRGYAFPSQQREAAFYGEDRAELIAINKVLVALDLIEIRKEMVLRTDEQGRRWRVPHNFYRVKDHADGFNLTTDRVLGVVELADREPAVYRLVRHVFSGRFAPIDADNPWGRILPELRRTPTWQRLATRVAAEEERAAARTRAGHAARTKRPLAAVEAAVDSPFFVPEPGATATPTPTTNDSGDVENGPGAETGVGSFNRGFGVDVESASNGSTSPEPGAVAGSNDGSAGDVPGLNNGPPTAAGPLNRTYHQDLSTTTTITDDLVKASRISDFDEPEVVASMQDPQIGEHGQAGGRSKDVTAEHSGASWVDTPASPVDGTGTAGPGGRAAPEDAPGELAAVRAFEDANARRSTPAERRILRGLAERYHDAAIAGRTTGWAWVAAAIYEAVEAGSAYVAPRRIREILTRWEREGAPVGGSRAEWQSGRAAERQGRKDSAAGVVQGASGRIEDVLEKGEDFPLPHGFGSRATWAFAVGLLAGALAPDRLAKLVAGTAITGYRDGEVTISAPDHAQAERLTTTHRELVTRKLSEAMRRPVRLVVLTAGTELESEAASEHVGRAGLPAFESPIAGPGDDDAKPTEFMVPECGLPSFQVWAAILEEIVARGDVTRANVNAWLRPTALIGRGVDGAFVVGVAHELARKRIAARFLPPLRAAVAAVAGVRLPIEVVVAREWRRANNGAGDEFSAVKDERWGA